MAKAGEDFELLVKAIYEEILSLDGFDTVRVDHDVNVFGKSGQAHQIDVYWEFKTAGVTHRVAVECKEYKSTVSVGKVRDFYGALSDIGNITGIFVTTKGYQSGAVKFADHKDISLKVLREPTEEDIAAHQGVKTINISSTARCIGNVRVTPNLDVEWILNNTELNEGDEFSYSALNNEVKILDSQLTFLGTVHDYENKLPREPSNTKGLSHSYEFDDGRIYISNTDYPPLKLNSLEFKYDTYSISMSSTTNFKLMAEATLKDIITGESHLYNKKASY